MSASERARAFAARCLGVLCLALAACAGSPQKPDPKPLQAIASPIEGRVLWQYSLGKLATPMSIATAAGVFTLVGGDGGVVSLQPDTGRVLWQFALGEPVVAGVGSDGRYAALVTAKGDLVVLEAGRLLWRQPLGVQVRTSPLVAGERVFVQASDRSVHAFDAQDGRKIWTLPRSGDPLTLLQPGVLRAFGDTLIVGQGARMVGLNSLNGAVIWETLLATPRGANEIERLADLVGPSARVGNFVCARAFQVGIGCVNAARGALLWSKNLGGVQGLAADADQVYAADASDRLQVWKLSTGLALWSSDALLNHGLGAPVLVGQSLVFGDERGIVHFLSRDTGAALLRLATDGSAIASPPAVIGGIVLVLTRKGGVFALRAD